MSSSSGSHWDADKIFQLYLHDYMVKRGMHETAAIFKKEAGVCNSHTVIDSPDGFLHEWWSIFHEVYSPKQQNNQKNGTESSSKAAEKTDERSRTPPIISHLSTIEQRPQQFQIRSNFNWTIGKPAACLLHSKVHDKEHLSHQNKDVGRNLHPINANKLKFMAGSGSNHLQEDIGKQPQKQVFRLQDSGAGIHLGRDAPRDPQYILQRTTQPVDGPCETNASDGFNEVPLNGSWPLNVGDGEHRNAAEDRPVDENVEPFLSNENENADNRSVLFSNLERISSICNTSDGVGTCLCWQDKSFLC